MKRSKTLLASNLLATFYLIYLLWLHGGMIAVLLSAFAEMGGTELANAMGAYMELLGASFALIFDILGMVTPVANIFYVILAMLCVHFITFISGCIVGWIAYFRRDSSAANFSAVFYLIGTICFPLYLFLSLATTIVAFIGAGNQKKINATTVPEI